MKHIGGDGVDGGVVADDPAEAGRGQSILLAPGEDTGFLPPQPERSEGDKVRTVQVLMDIMDDMHQRWKKPLCVQEFKVNSVCR